jgi:hypothetical protein
MAPYDFFVFALIKNTLRRKGFEDVETVKFNPHAATFRDLHNRVREVCPAVEDLLQPVYSSRRGLLRRG